MNTTLLSVLCALQLGTAAPQETTPSPAPEATPQDTSPVRLRPVVIYQTPKDLSRVGGSAHKISEKELKKQKYDAPDQALYSVPGVYIRQEDGYGLRPNIGLRGANSDRSKKVTLMEDGLLFGPAPYSAPAAYYFPLMTRLTGMDVIKGPAAILYGPQTIGGALNLFTRDLPRRGHAGGADLAYGLHNYSKVHAHHGWSGSRGGFLVEGVNLMTDGFKEIDGGGDSGFIKQEAMVKGRLTSDPLGDVFHRWDVKLGFSNETSNETYLGLSDADFRENPFRRYRSSALDQMNLMRFQGETSYTLQVDEDFDLNAAFYWRSLTRSWRKLNRFKSGPSLADILASPTSGIRKVYFDVLTGVEDSGSEDETLMIGDNFREFLVLGGQLSLRYEFTMGDFTSELRAGLRYHMDQIERDHTEDGYLMEGQKLVADGEDTQSVVRNRGKTDAIAGFLHYGMFGYGLTITPGLRVEHVSTGLLNRFTDELQENVSTTLLPGIGLHYELMEGLGIFTGVYQGFSPVAPGQAAEVLPETSINYEAGVRYNAPQTRSRLEAIGFFNNYSNLVGQCSFSSGCAPDDLAKQFNGGEVDIYGLELVAAHRFKLPIGFNLDLRASYTFTKTEFQSAFKSKNPQFDHVEVGDELPYVPVHQASMQVGVGQSKWAFDLNLVYSDAMREVAGHGTADAGELTDSFVMLDTKARYQPLAWLEIYLKGENLTMAKPIASRRPFGARPTKPLLISMGTAIHW
jgi:Fe(3+) dicitrate transport protein